MKLYVYCLVEGVDSLPPLHGILGFDVRLIKLGNFSALVSDFTGESVPVNRYNALAHASVVRSVLDETTPLPFRFSTVVSEQQLESYLNSRAEALKTKLDTIRGYVEMSVKIISATDPVRELSQTNHGDTREKPGTAFLAEKRREILGSEARSAEAKQIAEWLHDRVGALARETRVSLNPTERLLVAASHLVERGSVQEYRAGLGKVREERPDLHFLVSGPWAPYSFANIDLEFKTQFGVS